MFLWMNVFTRGMRDFWEFVIDLLPITFRSVSAVGLERARGQNPRGWGQNPRGRGHNPRGRGQVFRPRGRGQASRPNIPETNIWTVNRGSQICRANN